MARFQPTLDSLATWTPRIVGFGHAGLRSGLARSGLDGDNYYNVPSQFPMSSSLGHAEIACN